MVIPASFRPLVRIIGNVASLLTSDVLNRLTTFLLYALVGRHLEPRAFGQLSLALALFYTFQVFASLGLPMPLTREIARDRTHTASYLSSAGFLALLGGMASFLGLVVFVAVMGYARDTATVVLLLGLGLVPFALSTVCEAVFRAWERMHLIACANVPVNVAKIVAAYVFLQQGCTLNQVALLLLASTCAVFVIECGLMLWCIAAPRLRVDLAQAWRLARTSVTFLSIEGLIAVWSSACIVILSRLSTETDVALFNAAGQLLVPPMLVTQSVMLGIFPVLCRQYQLAEDRTELKRTSDRLIEVLLAVTLPVSVVLFVMADQMMVWAYGKADFAAGGLLLRIMVPTVAMRALSGVLGNALLAGERERVTLRIVSIDLAASLLLGIGLTYYYGVVGAAVAAMLVRVLDCGLHYWPAARLLTQLNLSRLAWKSGLAGVAMILVVFALRDLGMFVPLAVGSATYVAVLAGVMVYSHGGLKQLKECYLPSLALEVTRPSSGETVP